MSGVEFRNWEFRHQRSTEMPTVHRRSHTSAELSTTSRVIRVAPPRTLVAVAAIAFAAVLLAPALCLADPIAPAAITGGVATRTFWGTDLTVVGEDFTVDGFSGGGFSAAIHNLQLAPGKVIDLGSTAITPFGGSISYRGVTYSVSSDYSAGGLTFDTPAFTLPTNATVANISLPFTMGGLFGFVHTPTDRFQLALSGSGTATATAVFDPTVNAFGIRQIVYTFSDATPSPTPEPESIFLLCTGLIALVAPRAKAWFS